MLVSTTRYALPFRVFSHRSRTPHGRASSASGRPVPMRARSRSELLRSSLWLVVGSLTIVGASEGLSAQNSGSGQQVREAQEALRNLSREEILRRMRASGLTEAQIRDRLRQAGYDPALADRYFDEVGTDELDETGPADQEFLQILQSVGIDLIVQDTLRMPGDTLVTFEVDSLDTEEPDTALTVFGLDVFRRRTNQFEASPTGPVGPNYPVGPGDELILVLTGDVQEAYRLGVTREGVLVIPEVGQVSVNGLTVGQLERTLSNRLSGVYSGLRRGTTQFDLSLGRLRTNQIYVVGEVTRPGSYRISSVGTLLEALYEAGGPRETGSFRTVLVRRSNGLLVGAFDLYRYLTAGETAGIPRLQEGDVVFVPPVGAQVWIDGEVLRPAIYEAQSGEGLPELITYAGGLRPTARTDMIRIERIVPRSQRVMGRERIVLDADFDAVAEGRDTLSVRAGDRIEVYPVLEERRGWVEIDGAVYKPGRYELRDGSTVGSLVDRAGGALPDALDATVHVNSLDITDGSRRLARVPMSVAAAVSLIEFDRVTLFGRDSLLTPDSVGVYGFVRRPGRYPLAVGASPEDAILLAGGLAFGADPRRAEVTRLVSTTTDGVSVSTTIEVGLSNEVPYPGPATRAELPALDSDVLPSVDVVLAEGDEVYVRQVPQYRRPRRVEITGEVVTPGTYVLERMDETVSSLVRRAGGLTSRASARGFRLIRDGITVGVDLDEALTGQDGTFDPALRDGDRLVVPVVDNTVLVAGAVVFETRIVYREGMALGDAISEAGGVSADADKGRISVEYANGTRRTVRRVLGINVSEPEIRPGSTVFVPEAQEDRGFDLDSALTRATAVLGTLATLVIALR